jgi:tyrosine-protein phosphatase YwqE
MWERGVATIVATPHINASLTLEGDALERRLGQVDRAFEDAKVRLAEAYPGLTFLRGHEVMMDCPDPDFSDGRLHLARSGFVLVEWPRLQIPPETPRALRMLRRRQGVRLLIASDTSPSQELTAQDVRESADLIAGADILVCDAYSLLAAPSRAAPPPSGR